MSEGQAFDKSLLEGKDRNELVAIATSLGQKPPARAKKADVITLIMELVGAEPASPVDSAAAEPELPLGDSSTTSADEAGEEESGAEPEDGSDTSDGDVEDLQVENPTTDDASDPSAEEPSAGRSDEGSAPEADRNRNDRDQQGAQPRNQGNGNVEPGNRADPQQPQAEDGEGNRRRRRRGRDRNRHQEDEMVNAEPVDVEGFVDLRDEGYGFLRVDGYLPSPADAYISVKQVRQFGLRKGDVVTGKSRAANRNEKNPALIQLDAVNGVAVADLAADRPAFDKLTPLYPDEPLRLEQPEFPENMTARIVDLLAPIGKGQRGLVVSPPKAGKTTVMKDIIRAVERNHPEVHVIVLLVDERPEEVTDLRRWVLNGEVAASTFDRPSEEHVALAELVIERAKRLVESGKDVLVFLDGITRLTRAYNLIAPGNGRTMAGGMDTTALYPPKK
ncbi:MAG: transcription termination factor Rho, partial [Acidimicrobiales bacterium]|nr:transcription termination factor Rho [Acidimicrobiales bacterium]